MIKIKVSVIIPYARRFENIQYCLRSLNDQSLDKSEYEVIIGCLEYSTELLDFIKTQLPQLNIVLVMSNETWNTSRARNIAIREARGEVAVFVDADMILPNKYLELHYQTHSNSRIPLFILGQTRDYDEGLDINECKHHPYNFYATNFLNKNIGQINLPKDIRWTLDIYIDWAMGWTFNLSLNTCFLKEKNLYFDDDFKGWGVEDIEWAYRIKLCGAKVYFSDEIWAVHLPHLRNVNSNHHTEAINFKKMLCKWPSLEVEIVTSFGDIKGNLAFPKISYWIKQLTSLKYPDICTVELVSSSNESFLYIGATMSLNRNDLNCSNLPEEIKNFEIIKVLPLFGFSLPYDDKSFKTIYFEPCFYDIDADIREKVLIEANRLSDNVLVNSTISESV